MPCKTCGEHYEGDGYTVVLHCPNIDLDPYNMPEPDARPIDCIPLPDDSEYAGPKPARYSDTGDTRSYM